MKSERLRIEEKFNHERDLWEQDHKLDEVVDINDIAEVINQWTGIPVSQMMEDEKDKLLQMEERIHERLVGQREAVAAVADAIRRARSGLKDPR
jgi:ATP-dependent Clp protease ATP-binding subunit ClpC